MKILFWILAILSLLAGLFVSIVGYFAEGLGLYSSMIGKTMEVLVDGFDEDYEQFYGRTYGDSPDIDGRVWIASEEALVEGRFIKVCIDGLVDGDLSGYVVEDEE